MVPVLRGGCPWHAGGESAAQRPASKECLVSQQLLAVHIISMLRVSHGGDARPTLTERPHGDHD